MIVILDEQDFKQYKSQAFDSVTLPDQIQNVLKVWKIPSNQSYPFFHDLPELVISSKIGSILLNSVGSHGSAMNITGFYQMRKNLMESLQHSEVYAFNPETKKLYFNGNDLRYGESLILLASVREPERDLYNSEFLQKVMKAMVLRQWVINLGLKYNQEDANVVGNGLKLNISAMSEYAERLEEEIQEEIDNDAFMMITPGRMMSDY